MINTHTFATCALGLVLLTHGVDGQAVAQYRNFELGVNVAAVSVLTGVATSEAKTIHERPAVLQDLEWRPSRWTSSSAVLPSTDPVQQIAFSFYNDRLFRIVVDYDRDRTEGMTEADMVEALSAVYGATLPRAAGPARVASRVETESGSPVARWGDAGHAVVLYRTSSYRGGFRLIVTDAALDGLARKATAQAVRLDDQEAPKREVARLKKEQDDGRAAADKARLANKKVFRP
jgi:hypothetical protein